MIYMRHVYIRTYGLVKKKLAGGLDLQEQPIIKNMIPIYYGFFNVA